jgi:hypothetical protein
MRFEHDVKPQVGLEKFLFLGSIFFRVFFRVVCCILPVILITYVSYGRRFGKPPVGVFRRLKNMNMVHTAKTHMSGNPCIIFMSDQKREHDPAEEKKRRARMPKPLNVEEARVQKMRVALRKCGIRPDF